MTGTIGVPVTPMSGLKRDRAEKRPGRRVGLIAVLAAVV
jgi:hypothetical protein